MNEIDYRLADVKFFADYTDGYSTVQVKIQSKWLHMQPALPVALGKIFLQLVIQLPKVNDSQYPPQRKSFSMLAYYHDHQIENFDWFMRMDDDSVLQWDNLNEFLERDNKIYSDYLIGHFKWLIY